MDNIVNEPFLAKRAKYAKWGSYVGFGALFVGLMTTTRSPLLAYGFLLIGLLGASLGAYYANRYVREPRADQTFARVLEGLDKRYALYNYYAPSNHMLICHYGIILLEPRAQEGRVVFDNGRWQHKAGVRKLLQFFGEPSLGKPDQDVQKEVEWVKQWIDKVAPEDDYPVQGIVVFTSPKVALEVNGESVSAVTAEDLAALVKEGMKESPVLTTAKQKELRRIMDEVVAEQ